MFELALQIAEKAHAGQFRNDGVTPYIEHPKQVAAIFTTDKDKSIAILHDVIEDCEGYTFDVLYDLGITDAYVLNGVDAMSKRKGESNKLYIQRIVDCGMQKMKIADITVNLADDPTDHQKKKCVIAMKTLLAEV